MSDFVVVVIYRFYVILLYSLRGKRSRLYCPLLLIAVVYKVIYFSYSSSLDVPWGLDFNVNLRKALIGHLLILVLIKLINRNVLLLIYPSTIILTPSNVTFKSSEVQELPPPSLKTGLFV